MGLSKQPTAAPTRKMKFTAVALVIGVALSSAIRLAVGDATFAELEQTIPIFSAWMADVALAALVGAVGWTGGYLTHEDDGEDE